MPDPTLLKARELAANLYPEFITDSRGREQANIPRKAILSGAWDDGSIVRGQMEQAEKLLQGERG